MPFPTMFIALLEAAMTNIEKIKEAITTIREGTYRQIKEYIIDKYGPISDKGYNADIIAAAVNHTSRGHYNQNRKSACQQPEI
jgi:hypothetical protein